MARAAGRPAAILLLSALLASCACAATAGNNGQKVQKGTKISGESLKYTERFLNAKVGENMIKLSENWKAMMAGKLKHQMPTPKKQIKVNCLYSVAPEPLNWKMWCPQSHANVTQWVDKVGSTHRKIVLQPMPDMTSQMAVWFMTPMFPKTMNMSGKVFTKNQLWHPLDHKPKQQFKLSPGKGLLEPPTLMSKLDEIYRMPQGKVDRGYKTELWVSAMDLAINLPRNRYVLGFDVLGFQAFTLIVEFNDSPGGLVVSVEIILGAAALGYDERNPFKGVPPPLAKAANALLFEAVMKPYRKNGDFEGALNAVTRHVVEEFGNLPNFVPQAWASDARGRITKELASFKKNLISLSSPVNTSASSSEGNLLLSVLKSMGADKAAAALSKVGAARPLINITLPSADSPAVNFTLPKALGKLQHKVKALPGFNFTKAVELGANATLPPVLPKGLPLAKALDAAGNITLSLAKPEEAVNVTVGEPKAA